MTIKAIETAYKGYRFRSRLEARWAVFFDALGWQWEYEPEGFELPSGWYLPDFLVRSPHLDRYEGNHLWIEIKPASASWPDDFKPTWELAAQQPWTAWILVGTPWPGEHLIYDLRPTWNKPFPESDSEIDVYNCFTECRRCDGLYLLASDDLPNGFGLYAGSRVGWHSCGDHDKEPLPPSDSYARSIFKAYKAAHSARFTTSGLE